jgi:hypothetical protein
MTQSLWISVSPNLSTICICTYLIANTGGQPNSPAVRLFWRAIIINLKRNHVQLEAHLHLLYTGDSEIVSFRALS